MAAETQKVVRNLRLVHCHSPISTIMYAVCQELIMLEQITPNRIIECISLAQGREYCTIELTAA